MAAAATDDTAERLLAAAVRIFADKGFAGASVRDIVEAAGANIAAVNYHFQGKENLYAAAVERAYRTCYAAKPPLHLAGPPRLKLTAFIRHMLGHMLEQPDPAAMQLMMREMFQPTTPACAQWVNDYIRPFAEVLRGILRELKPKATDEQIWLCGFSIVGQCLYYRQNLPVVEQLVGAAAAKALTDADRLAAHVAAFSLGGLGLTPSKEGRP